ncbi:hypothetical protein RFI_29298 [Reticulomyxa filosa]|uniref:PLOD1-3-like GT domain-containing protein n=1 Tax=Reticulomyxa filosa TaxID=46433 RepID=X6M3P6_RETFI|nr:hypothetical protein RFI_29298 [Reticulomyxa filosa]|eukprot:ETO08092.1 hypothetical protein RFI_29298 [Reticulomyxa filosa]
MINKQKRILILFLTLFIVGWIAIIEREALNIRLVSSNPERRSGLVKLLVWSYFSLPSPHNLTSFGSFCQTLKLQAYLRSDVLKHMYYWGWNDALLEQQDKDNWSRDPLIRKLVTTFHALNTTYHSLQMMFSSKRTFDAFNDSKDQGKESNKAELSETIVMFGDAFDILYFSNMSKILQMYIDAKEIPKDKVLFNAEYSCFPLWKIRTMLPLCDHAWTTIPKWAWNVLRTKYNTTSVEQLLSFKHAPDKTFIPVFLNSGAWISYFMPAFQLFSVFHQILSDNQTWDIQNGTRIAPKALGQFFLFFFGWLEFILKN